MRLLLAACLLTLPQSATAAAQEPVTGHEAASIARYAGRGGSAEFLVADLLARHAGVAADDERAQALLTVDAVQAVHLTRATEAWEEVLALLEPADLAASAQTEAVFLLRFLHAETLRQRGRFDEARALMADLGYFADYRVVGPFENERGAGMRRSFPPESGVDLDAELEGKERSVSWRANPGAEHPLKRVVLDSLFRPAQQVVGYLATGLYVEEEREVVLRVGATSGYQVFVGGTQVFESEAERPRFPDQDRVPLRLAPGWNTLLLKAGVESGAWSLETRLTDLDGAPVTDVRIDSSRAGAGGDGGAAEGTPRRSARQVLAELTDDAEAQRALAVYHLVAHPEDRVDRSALAAARRAHELDPESEFGLYLLARALRPRGVSRAEMTIAPYVSALYDVLERNPRHVWALLDLADYASELNPTPQREEELSRRALAEAPTCGRALRSRVRYLNSRGRETEGELLIRELLERSPERGRASSLVALARRELRGGDRIRYRELLEQACSENALGGEHLELLISYFADAQDTRSIQRWTDRSLQANPFAVHLMLRAGELLEYAGDVAGARALFERALRVQPEHVGAHLDLARLDDRAGQAAAVRERLQRVLEIEPGNDRVRRRLALMADDDGGGESERFEEPWRRDAAELVSLPMPDDAEGEQVEVLERTTVYRVYPDGAESRYEHLVLRVLSRAGVEALDNFPILSTPGSSLQVMHVRVLRPDGTEERAPSPRRLRPGLRLYDLPLLSIGDVIDVEYRADETEPDVFGEYFGTRHMFFAEQLGAPTPTRTSRLVVIAPPGLAIYHAARNADGVRHEVAEGPGGTQVFSWVATDLKRPDPESLMPRPEEIVPVVDVTTFESWEAFGDWWWGFIEKEFDTSPELEAKVDELTAGLETEEEKVRAILRFVAQEIRYNAWPFGTHGYEPFSASTIFDRRFGDCKDKSILLRQMLGRIGVEAIPVLIKAEYSRAEDPLDVAMIGAFNHCIAYVQPTDERGGYYLDATSELNPMEYLRADDQGARVLHVGPDGAAIHEIPYAPAEDNAVRREYDVDLQADGGAEVTYADTSTGDFGVRLRNRYQGEQGTIEKNLAQALAGGFGKVEIEEVRTSELEDLSVDAHLEARFRGRDLWVREGKGARLRTGFDPLGFVGVATEPAAERDFDLVFDRPFSIESTVRWHVPEGTELLDVPDDVSIEAPGKMRYEMRIERVGERFERPAAEVVEIRRSFRLFDRRVRVDDYPAFKRALEDVRQAEERTIGITPPESTEGGGR